MCGGGGHQDLAGQLHDMTSNPSPPQQMCAGLAVMKLKWLAQGTGMKFTPCMPNTTAHPISAGTFLYFHSFGLPPPPNLPVCRSSAVGV